MLMISLKQANLVRVNFQSRYLVLFQTKLANRLYLVIVQVNPLSRFLGMQQPNQPINHYLVIHLIQLHHYLVNQLKKVLSHSLVKLSQQSHYLVKCQVNQ
jgi:hypothetical protein